MFLVYFCNHVTRRLCRGHTIHYPPKKNCIKNGFRFLLGVTVVLAEIQDNGFANFFFFGGGGGKQGALWSMRKW